MPYIQETFPFPSSPSPPRLPQISPHILFKEIYSLRLRTAMEGGNAPCDTETDCSSFIVQAALETARESSEGAENPQVKSILEAAIEALWGRICASPDSYIMDREEFAVFNYFQAMFCGNEIASRAIGRFWATARPAYTNGQSQANDSSDVNNRANSHASSDTSSCSCDDSDSESS